MILTINNSEIDWEDTTDEKKKQVPGNMEIELVWTCIYRDKWMVLSQCEYVCAWEREERRWERDLPL